MNILIINCSPVMNGATAEIANTVSRYLQNGNTVKTICIDDFDIKYCRGCRKCHTTAECFQQDDTKKVIVYYEWADKIVSVSPSYWADIPGQFKDFYGHLEITASDNLSLCSIECKDDVANRIDEIKCFCDKILNS